MCDRTPLYFELCEGRHKIPEAVDGAIFKHAIDPSNIDAMMVACDLLLSTCKNKVHLHVYVTGLSVALVSVINYCQQWGIPLTLHHWNPTIQDYYTQEVLIYPRAS